jgi:hypothetical protein
MCGWSRVCIEAGRDPVQAYPRTVLRADSFDHLRRQDRRTTSRRRYGARLRRLSSLGNHAFEFVNGDQPRAPGHLDRVDVRQDSADEGRAADAESFGGLRARVGEPFDVRSAASDDPRLRYRYWIRLCRSESACSRDPTAARHANIVHKL